MAYMNSEPVKRTDEEKERLKALRRKSMAVPPDVSAVLLTKEPEKHISAKSATSEAETVAEPASATPETETTVKSEQPVASKSVKSVGKTKPSAKKKKAPESDAKIPLCARVSPRTDRLLHLYSLKSGNSMGQVLDDILLPYFEEHHPDLFQIAETLF